jgi:hypothetical protein
VKPLGQAWSTDNESTDNETGYTESETASIEVRFPMGVRDDE